MSNIEFCNLQKQIQSLLNKDFKMNDIKKAIKLIYINRNNLSLEQFEELIDDYGSIVWQ